MVINVHPDQLLTVAQAARVLGVHGNTVRAWTEQGLLQCVRINRRGDRRYDRAELESFLALAAGAAVAPPTKVAPPKRVSAGSSLPLGDADERSRRAQLLLDLAADLGRQMDPNHVLRLLVDRAAELFHADRAGIFTRIADGGVQPVATRNLSPEFCLCLQHARNLPIMTTAFEERRIVSLPDYPDDPRAYEMRRALLHEGINTVTVAPLYAEDEPLGMLVLYHDSRYDWRQEDLELLERLAEHGSMLIRHGRNYSRMERWAAQLQSIQQLGTRLTRLRSVVEIGQAICTELNQLINTHNIRVYRVEGEDCVPVAWRGEVGEYEDEDGEALRLQVGEGITGWVARYGIAQNVADAAADSRARTIPGTEDDVFTESLLLAPMLFEDEVIGVIVLAKIGHGQFGPDDLRVLEIYASIAAQAMANADATERLREQSEALARQLHSQRELLRVTESILTTLDTQTLLDEIADRLSTLVATDNISVSLLDATTRRLHTIFARGVHAAQFLKTSLAENEGISGIALMTGEAQLISDEMNDVRVVHRSGQAQPGALIVVPLRGQERMQGVLVIERLGADAHFSDEEFELVKLFAAHVSIALRNAAVHRAVELRAETDPLTGLLNHGALTEHLERLVDQRERFAMLMVDLDFFKSYNDSLGHQAGNEMLQRVAGVLRASCRDADLIFRFGGDEFAVLLPNTGLSGGRTVADMIHNAIAGLGRESSVPVACSVGIAVYPKDGHDAMSIPIAADRACYAAKRGGRDRIATASEGLALAGEFRPTEPTPAEQPAHYNAA